MSQALIDEFHTRLDEALVIAITSEYDLNDPKGLQEARTVLQTLAQDAEVEEASGFAPDGLGTRQNVSSPGGNNSRDVKSSQGASSQATKDRTETQESLESSCTSTTFDDEDAFIPRIESLDDATEQTKIKQLASMFPSLKPNEVKDALAHAGGDFQGALEELLTLQFLQSVVLTEREKPKAIDAFFKPEDEWQPAKRKGKKKRKNPQTGTPTAASFTSVKQVEDSEAVAVKRILFISERLDIPFETTASAYYDNGCSQAKATVAILDDFIAQGVEAQDKDAVARVQDLGKQYKRVPAEYLSAAVQLTPSIAEWAADIAKLLDKHFSEAPVREALPVSYNLTPVADEVEDGFTLVAPKNGNVKKLPAPQTPATKVGGSWEELKRQAAMYSEARLAATEAATQAIRRGRSNRLYGQGAIVYTERAKEYAQKAREASSLAAYRLVEERRDHSSIDLHGVSVNDGVQIAQEAVREWYDGLGEFKAREARNGFTIVTGLGRHSPGGVSRMRQAVSATLFNDGWKFVVGTGKFVVTGRL